MARLNHPNIVRVYGGCMTPPNLFVVEELLAGDLSAHIHRRGPGSPPLDLSMSLGIAINIAAGLVSLFHAKPGKLGGCACMERGNKLRLLLTPVLLSINLCWSADPLVRIRRTPIILALRIAPAR